MKCPVDGTALLMTDRQGVEIDYCPSCRGVWLDRGELDKILDRTAAEEAHRAPARRAAHPETHPPEDRRYDPRYGGKGGYGYGKNYGDKHGYKRKKPKSLLKEIFDL